MGSSLAARAESGSPLRVRGRRKRAQIADSRIDGLVLHNLTDARLELVNIIPPNLPHQEKCAQRAIRYL